jgi:hypothetical protein
MKLRHKSCFVALVVAILGLPCDSARAQACMPDVTPPTITCPVNLSVSNDSGQCSAVLDIGMPVTSDACSAVTVSISRSDGLALSDPYPVGNTIVTWTAVDASFNTNTCTQTIAVADAEIPMITCPPEVLTNAAMGECSVTVSFDPPTASDNCTNTPGICTPASGSSFAAGTNTVTCRVTDAAGHTNTCTFLVIVLGDATPPGMVCPVSVVTSAAPGQCSNTVSFTPPTATDNCTNVSVACTPPSGSTFAVGTNMVSCVATDPSGNSASCSFDVTVQDTEPPAISCPGDLEFVADGPEGIVVNYSTPTATDNCGVVSTGCVPPSGSTFPSGVTNVTCTAVDASSNTNTCSFSVTVFDLCFVDDETEDSLLLSSVSGDYRFTWNEFDVTVQGKAKVKQAGLNLTARSKDGTNRLSLKWHTIKNTARGKVVFPTVLRKARIRDANVTGNVCE